MNIRKYMIGLILIGFYQSYAHVLPITPGESLYGIVTRIGSELDTIDSNVDQLTGTVNNLSVQDALIYNTATQIDSKVDILTVDVSNLSVQDVLIYNAALQISSQVSSLATTFTSSGNSSAQDALIYSTVSQIDSKVDTLLIDVNNMSVQDALIYNTVTQIDTKADTLLVNVNNLSARDALIYSTVTQIDTKVDTLLINVNNISVQDALIYATALQISSQVSALATSTSGSGGCCNSAQDALTYNTVTSIDTKVDTLLINVNNLSSQDVLIYNISSQIDSKVDTLKNFPEFAQTPTGFNSEKILANTSRYFFNKRTIADVGSTELLVFSLRNDSATEVVRISAVGCGLDAALGAGSGNASGSHVALYKVASLTGSSFSSFNANSVLSIDTSATAFSGGIQVFEVQAGMAQTAIPRAFEYIPKELYSVIIAPGDILTVTAAMAAANPDTISVIVMWEEIIN